MVGGKLWFNQIHLLIICKEIDDFWILKLNLKRWQMEMENGFDIKKILLGIIIIYWLEATTSILKRLYYLLTSTHNTTKYHSPACGLRNAANSFNNVSVWNDAVAITQFIQAVCLQGLIASRLCKLGNRKNMIFQIETALRPIETDSSRIT